MRDRDRAARIATKRRICNELIDQHRSISGQLRDRLTDTRQHLAEARARFVEIDHARGSLYRPMVGALHLARACAEAGTRLAADAYIAHDDVALVAADYLAATHGGRLIYDAVEPFDHEQKTSAFHTPAPAHELSYYALLTGPAVIRADTRFSTSGPLADLLSQRFGVPFIELPNYVDAPVTEPSSSTIRQECGCSDTDFLLLYINSIYSASRYDQIILAIAQCDPSCHLVHVGNIWPQNLEQELYTQVELLGLQHRVHFFPAMPYHGYLDYISACDAALVWLDISNVNCATNLHNRYLDAVGAGLPILSSQNIAFEQLNNKYDLGLVVPQQDPDSLAAYIRAMRDRRAGFLGNMPLAQSALRWRNVEDRLIKAVSGCKSVAIVAWKDPRPNQRIQRQARTLRRHGIEVSGIGNLADEHRTGDEPGAWFKVPRDIDGEMPDPKEDLDTVATESIGGR